MAYPVKKKPSTRKMFRRGIRNRYVQRVNKKKAFNIGAIVKDVRFLKSQLNAEHKHIDTTFGSNGTYTAQAPVHDTPIIIPLSLPDHGTKNFNRIGNQIVITHITCKYRYKFGNLSDYVDKSTMRARIVFAKDASSVPVITNLLKADPNGNYTPASFTNEQEYKKYIWLKSLDCKKSHTNNRRYAYNGETINPQVMPRGLAYYYPYKKWNGRIKTEFTTGTDTNQCTVNKPYLVLTCDVPTTAGNPYDNIEFSGTVRLTYIDN